MVFWLNIKVLVVALKDRAALPSAVVIEYVYVIAHQIGFAT